MKIRERFPLILILALAAAVALLPAGARAGRPYDTAINNEKAEMFQGKVVSVDPAGLSVSVRGDAGFRTFRTRPNLVKGLSAGDGVSVSYLPGESGPKVMSLSVTEKARGATEAERLRLQREERRKQAADQKAAKNSRYVQPTQTVNDALGYGRGYYQPQSER